MRPRPLAWLLLSVLCFAGAFYFWRLGDQWAAKKAPASPPQAHAPALTHHASRITPAPPLPLMSQAATLNSPPATEPDTQHATRTTNRFALRLSNTTTPMAQLQRDDHALLLENALLDTTRPVPSIPDHLRSQGDPGSYLVQSRGPITDAFRSLLQAAGGTADSHFPSRDRKSTR